MIKILLTVSTLLTLSILMSLNAQTVNTGELTITNDTEFSTVENFNNTKTGSFINNGDVYAYHNWNNDGIVDHDNEGITRFLGINEQIISGTNVNYFNDVLFEVSPTVQSIELSGSLSVSNESVFNNGVIDNSNFGGSFIFEQNGYHTNTANNSFVNGKVLKLGDQPFNYPIGADGFYRYAEITSPFDVDDIFSGEYFFNNPDIDFPLANKEENIELINDQEYWIINREIGNSTVLLTLSWDENTTTPLPLIEDPLESIHIVRWDVNEQQWKDEGGFVNQSNKTVTTPLLLENYGVFTLARVSEIFDGDLVILNGVTPNDDGANDYFQITNIQDFPNNKVEIFNRWGAKVFETSNYDTSGNVFNGESQNSLTIGNGLLPTATYYYIIHYEVAGNQGSTQRKSKAGFLYLNTD